MKSPKKHGLKSNPKISRKIKKERHAIMTKLLSDKVVFESPIFDIRQRELTSPEQGNFSRTILHMFKDAIAVALIDTKSNKIYVTTEYRAGIDETIDSIPAGKIDDSELPAQAVFREVREETGIQIDNTANDFELHKIATINSSEGALDEKVHVFAIKADFSQIAIGEKDFDEDEFVTGEFVDAQTWTKSVIQTPHSAPAVAIAYWYQLEQLKNK